MPGTPSALGLLFFVTYFLLALKVNQHQVCIMADGDSPLAGYIPYSCWRIAHPVHNLFKATPLVINLVEHQCQHILYRRESRGRLGVRQFLFLSRVWGMVRRDHLDPTVE